MATIVSGSANAARTQGVTNPSTPAAMAVALTDGEGNLLRSTALGDGTAALGAAGTLLALPSAAYTSTVPTAATFATDWVTYAAVDITLASFTGGTAPAISFFFERQGADGVWYQIFTTGALTTPQTISVDVSPALNGSVSGPLSSTVQHNVFSHSARLRWTFGGTAVPTAVTFSASVVGR